jgi:hypothetical protein
MRYPMPNYPCDFEIPDDWLAEAALNNFTPTSAAYRSSDEAAPVPFKDVEPPYRVMTHPKDWRGFDRTRLVSILKGFVAGAEIEPVPLLELPPVEFPLFRPYRYRVSNGFHRFYASIAAGFTHLSGVVS